jgi:peptidoglycan-associated lipoprotein
MQSYLQVMITRFVVSFVFLFGALSGNFAQELHEEADVAFNRRGYFEASSDYVAAYAKVKSDLMLKAYCAFQAGECFRLMHDPRGATEWYDKALGLRYANTNPRIYLLYGDALRDQEDYYTAMEWYEKFGENGDRSLADARIEAADIAAIAMEEPPSRFIVEPMIIVNSPSYDFAPVYASKKSDVLVFASSRLGSTGTGEDPITGERYMDLFTTTQDKKGDWKTPEPLSNLCSDDNEGSASFDKRFKTIYFTRCVDQDGSNLACDIYYAPVVGNNFGAPQPLFIVDREQDDSTQIGHPALSLDDNYMVFASDLPGGFGGKDLWFAAYNDDNDTWGLPQNLGASINTAGDEMFPSFRANGALYFSSNGHGGLGGFDLCFANEREGVMAFSDVETLPYPLSSANDELGIIFKGQTNTGIFSSNRNGGKGQDDLYEFRLPPMEFCYRAYVYDYDTGMPVSGASITLESSEGKISSETSNEDGSLELCDGEIEEGVSYDVDVKNEGFIGTGDRFSSIGLTESTTFAREYFLKEIVLEKEYDMPLVLYPSNSAELLINEEVNSADSLEFLLDLLVRNENLVIQLEAHTDSRGTDSANKKLSQKRAETCVNFLLDKGISADRLVPFGHGEEMLIITDAQIAKLPASEREGAHQVNRRTVFRIIRFDYVPTEE